MQLNNKRLSILNIGGELKVMPGIHDYPQLNARMWDDLQKRYPKVKMLVDEDLLILVEGSGNNNADGEEAPAPQGFRQKLGGGSNNTLARYKEKDAIRLVKETADDGLLTQWHETEERPAVIQAIEDQFAALARAGEPK